LVQKTGSTPVYARDGAIVAVPFDLRDLRVTGEPIPVVEEIWMNPTFGTAHFALSQNGTLAYVPPREAARRLVWVDRGGSVRPITESLRGFEDPRLSPDGQRIAVTILERGGVDIWVYDFARDSFTRLSFASEEDQAPIWTPDGNRVTFRRGASSNIFWQPADGSGTEERLTTSKYTQRPGSWSLDGTVLVFWENQPARRNDLWLLTLEGERGTRPFQQTIFNEVGGVFSPDGRYVAYSSDESGRPEVYVRPFAGPGGKWQISSDGGGQPVWARNGQEIFYRNGDEMMAVSIDVDPSFRVGRPVLLFKRQFHLPASGFAQYDVTTDERFVMIQDVESGPTQIEVVLNWFEELKARVPTRSP
jgi:serine/threonine-protein kinase